MLQNLKAFLLIPVQFFHSATKLTYFSLAFAAVIGVLYFGIMFRKRDGFDEYPTIDFTQAPEFEWTKWKLILLVMISVGSYLIAYDQLPDLFPSFFRRE